MHANSSQSWLHIRTLKLSRMWHSVKGKTIGIVKRSVVASGSQGGRNGELVFNGYVISSWVDENILEMVSGNGCTTL